VKGFPKPAENNNKNLQKLTISVALAYPFKWSLAPFGNPLHDCTCGFGKISRYLNNIFMGAL
jgi:hypothetical protein